MGNNSSKTFRVPKHRQISEIQTNNYRSHSDSAQ